MVEEKEMFDDDMEVEAGEDSFEAMLNEYEQGGLELKRNDVVQGTVVQVNPDSVVVDVGYKSEGVIPLREFANEKGEINVNVGDVYDVLFGGGESDSGMINLSKEKADRQKIWNNLEEDAVVEGRIINRIKGGLSVDIGVMAFLPGSQVDLRPVRNLDKVIGETFEFKIIKLNKRRGNIVLSRRVLLEKERESLRSGTLENLVEEQVVDGIVKNLTDYGAFIDLGGIDGLLHITDMSWGRVKHPSDIIAVGDRIKVKVLKFDRDKERVSLGLKQIAPDPWLDVQAKYPVDVRVTGKVVSLTDYGAFIELEEGVEGLIHVSEMSWTKRIKHPNKILNIGDDVESVVLALDTENRRISLGLKQIEPNPWEVIGEKFPIGTIIEGQVKNITDFGVFVGVDEGIDGLVHISDLSWTKRIKHPSEAFKKGDVVKAVVLNIDRENERFSLGLKQLNNDPWESVPTRYAPGTIIKGAVTSVTDFGIFLELEEGIEGLIHVSELSKEKVEEAKDFAKVGDVLEAAVLQVDSVDRKIALSIKNIDVQKEKAEVNNFLGAQKTATSNLGALLQGVKGRNDGKDA
ncbi:30S ribosomal protein S1 [Geopsychrobacter electrodiphilus]|uniref:30S ribosomal protein S1 n=1 Tax=Geopsychrobacter electrodiphilus TaxID=225196 RepID=UPI000367528F|nr:30S ribosomal protein S1 [Geopsychrobacter electrodiphilus]